MNLNFAQARSLIAHGLRNIADHREYLNGLDRALGDGDHGNTIARGVNAALDALSAAETREINQLFSLTGKAMINSMGGASGVLFGTFFRGAEHCPNSEILDTPALASFCARGLRDLRLKTKAAVGDKTLMDAIVPVVDELSSNEGPLPATLVRAAEAAEKGARSTVGLVARFGRARTLGERAASAQDPGATSISLFFRGLADHISQVEPS